MCLLFVYVFVQTLTYKTLLHHITPVSQWTHSYTLSSSSLLIRVLAAQLQLPIKYVHPLFFFAFVLVLISSKWMLMAFLFSYLNDVNTVSFSWRLSA